MTTKEYRNLLASSLEQQFDVDVITSSKQSDRMLTSKLAIIVNFEGSKINRVNTFSNCIEYERTISFAVILLSKDLISSDDELDSIDKIREKINSIVLSDDEYFVVVSEERVMFDEEQLIWGIKINCNVFYKSLK